MHPLKTRVYCFPSGSETHLTGRGSCPTLARVLGALLKHERRHLIGCYSPTLSQESARQYQPSTESPMKATFTLNDGTVYNVRGKYVVCDRCRGMGVHDHPAFANGIGEEDFAEDPEFRENYFSGRYDVACEECKGIRVIGVPDEDYMTPAERKAWETWQNEDEERCRQAAQDAAIYRAECGCHW